MLAADAYLVNSATPSRSRWWSWPPDRIAFFFNDTATTELYTLSLHDALPISVIDLTTRTVTATLDAKTFGANRLKFTPDGDRKSTRLNSSHDQISYAVVC